MKTKLFLLFFFIFILNATGQMDFEKGYFIDNDGQKVDCLIKNKDWKNNPTEFQYKKSKKGNAITASLDKVKEFSISNKSKYIRAQVAMDRSSNDLKILSEVKKAEFNDETLFLKILVEGTASLYYFEEKELRRFFYKKEDTPITQLVYKKYKVDENNYGDNNRYKQQIINHLQCYAPLREKTMFYKKEYLVSLFKDYNECKGVSFVEYDKKNNKDKFAFSLKAGVMLNSFDLLNGTIYNTYHENLIGYKFGFAVEFFLPFNNNKWALQLEPTFQSFKFDESYPHPVYPGTMLNTSLNYKAIEFSAGLKYYIFLNEKSKIFVNGFAVQDFSFSTEIINRSSFIVKNGFPGLNFSIGTGYELSDKYNIEFRYSARKNLLNEFIAYNGNLKGFAIVLGYRF